MITCKYINANLDFFLPPTTPWTSELPEFDNSSINTHKNFFKKMITPLITRRYNITGVEIFVGLRAYRISVYYKTRGHPPARLRRPRVEKYLCGTGPPKTAAFHPLPYVIFFYFHYYQCVLHVNRYKLKYIYRWKPWLPWPYCIIPLLLLLLQVGVGARNWEFRTAAFMGKLN